MFGGEEEDEQEFELGFCKVESLCVATFEERDVVRAMVFFEFAFESRDCISWFERSSV